MSAWEALKSSIVARCSRENTWSVALSFVIPGGDILCRRDSGNGDKFFCAPDALRPPPRPTSSLGSRARRLPQMARRRIGCACIGPSLAPGPAAPAPLRPHARPYPCRGLPASCFALPWRAAGEGVRVTTAEFSSLSQNALAGAKLLRESRIQKSIPRARCSMASSCSPTQVAATWVSTTQSWPMS